MKKINLLTFNGVYKPGFKGGGPIKSISNMALTLNKDINFYIITSDRDFDDKKPYPNIKINSWNKVDNEMVYYHEGGKISIFKLLKLVNNLDIDIIYLNGYYSNYTRKLLILKKLKLIKQKTIILCPRGDFSEGKGNKLLKQFKKNVYIKSLNILGFNKKVIWHATSETEKDDIYRKIGKKVKLYNAPNIPTIPKSEIENIEKVKGSLNLVYISRINRKKNLLSAIKMLKGIEGQINFRIYGPIFEDDYWLECKKEINKLNDNITIEYLGSINSEYVSETLSNNHFMLFPTNGENYGHIIYEAISVGCPVIISDKTPWNNLKVHNAGWDIPLDNIEGFKEIILKCLEMDDEDYKKMRHSTNEYAKLVFQRDQSISSTKEMLLGSLNKNR